MTINLFETIPIWGMFLMTMILSWVAYEIGSAFGEYHQTKSEKLPPDSGYLIGATLGLMILILAFTFSTTSYLFEERRRLDLDESNAMKTAYLRSGYLHEPYRTKLQNLMREYVTLMLESSRTGVFEQLLKRFETMQRNIWLQSEELAETQPNSPMVALFIQSLNDIVNIHEKRVMTGGNTLIPGIIWFGIFFILILAYFAIGYHSGMSGQRNLLIYVFILAYTSIFLLTIDLDRPQEGVLKISYQTVFNLNEWMNAHMMH